MPQKKYNDDFTNSENEVKVKVTLAFE